MSYLDVFKYDNPLPARVAGKEKFNACSWVFHPFELSGKDIEQLLAGELLILDVNCEYEAVIRLRKEDMNKLRLVFFAALLTACTHTSNTPPQCSPAAYSALGELCTQAMAQALLDCSARTVETCPVAAQAAQACRVLMAAQDAECKGTAP